MSRWLGLLLIVAGLAALISWWPSIWLALLLTILYMAYIVVLSWAGRRRFIHFEAEANTNALLDSVPSQPPLRTEELIPIRASGQFSVEGQTRYFADVEADFETVGTREHIILGRVHASRFLFVGRWPVWEHGWWYIFFQPAAIQELTIGHFTFGPQSRLALRIVHTFDEENTETTYLTFTDAPALRRVWADLVKDAPVGVNAGRTR